MQTLRPSGPSAAREKLMQGLARLNIGSEEASTRSQFAWSIGGIVVIVLALTASAFVYIRPLNTNYYWADMAETGGLIAGNEVRIAGIPVGKVTKIQLERDHVEAEFTVKEGIPIGAESALDIRMLTPVGGLYVEIVPAGVRPLGTDHIPAERVQLPYQVSKIVEAAPPVIEGMEVDTLRQSLAAMNAATKDAPGSLRTIIDGAENLTAVFAEQKHQMGSLLSLANEYIGAVDSQKDALIGILHQIANLQNNLLEISANAKMFADSIAAVIGKASIFMVGVYQERIEPIFPGLENIDTSMKALAAQIDDSLGSIHNTVAALADLVGPDGRVLLDQSRNTLMAPNVCIPVPGRSC